MWENTILYNYGYCTSDINIHKKKHTIDKQDCITTPNLIPLWYISTCVSLAGFSLTAVQPRCLPTCQISSCKCSGFRDSDCPRHLCLSSAPCIMHQQPTPQPPHDCQAIYWFQLQLSIKTICPILNSSPLLQINQACLTPQFIEAMLLRAAHVLSHLKCLHIGDDRSSSEIIWI